MAEDIAPIDEAQALLADESNTIAVIERYGPSVVAVSVTIRGEPMSPVENIPEDQIPPPFRGFVPFLEEQEPVRQSAGSGFLITVDGAPRLVTNFHVVQEALEDDTVAFTEGGSIEVVFPVEPQRPLPVKVIGVNPSFDLALLELVDPAYPPAVEPLTIADSDMVKVGQKTIAIGNPFGLASTVTSGIVSGVGRMVPSVGQIPVPMIQTDAAINPGNSGGPLLNSKGELIGINTALLNPGGRSFAGLGFAVPSNLLIESLANLELGGLSDITSTRPSLGILARSVGLLPKSVRKLLALPDTGVVILEVRPESLADTAGLRGSQTTVPVGTVEMQAGGDIIIAVNGMAIASTQELNHLVTYESMVGDMLTITILRDSEELEIPIVLALTPED
ncbi:MAG: trypsin-like serine protease [Hyphomicrobiales bacterium]|nr:trypsin-like serine protease [Hyphomicrobiales bacterium]